MGLIWKPCTVGEHYDYGAERGGRSDADRSGFERLWRIIPCCAILRRARDCCKCSTELFYARDECSISGNTAYPAQRMSGRGSGMRKLVPIIRAAFNQRRKTLQNSIHKAAEFLNFSKEQVVAALEEMQLSQTVRGEVLSLKSVCRTDQIFCKNR